MTSANRPMDSPRLSATGRLSSRDRRNVALLSAGALGPAAGVVVMKASSSSDAKDLPAQPRVMSPAATLAYAGERAVYGVIPSQEGHDDPPDHTIQGPPRYVHPGCDGKKSLASRKRIDRTKGADRGHAEGNRLARQEQRPARYVLVYD